MSLSMIPGTKKFPALHPADARDAKGIYPVIAVIFRRPIDL
jgi:hypothetical protein